ncbi:MULTISPECIES: molybdenum cofactor guanylyltransferase MobA [unclassified Roseitalea]|uniref:molybdenum cofactor guanylyltransferase MobA n=1 Tax=unclassified Roseitalea TaxID=2639107 RepID=UPI00273DE1E2|nr:MULTISPECIES: molybdenum cofactor guanylyltransferase MobA [unclassified Roseitalea]
MTEASPHGEQIVGVVLAGGLSRRMNGQDKALMPLAGKPLIGHVIDRLAPQVGLIAINANGDPQRFAMTGLPVFADTIPGHAGPLAGVLAAMDFARARGPGLTHVATAATDTPFLPLDLVARLAAASATPDTIAMAHSHGQRHPVFALWPVGLADDLRAFLASTESYKVMVWVERHRLRPVEFGTEGGDPFFNINTPAELAHAKARFREEARP